MLKILSVLSLIISFSVIAQSEKKEEIEKKEETESSVLTKGGALSIRTQKKIINKVPPIIAPVQNNLPASCADSLGGNFTDCEANKKSR